MTVLPAVRWGGAAWRLPLAPRSAEGLAAVLLDRTSGGGGASEPLACDVELSAAAIGGLLRIDPSLAIFSALEYLRADPLAAGTAIEIDELAMWLTEAAANLWLDGDRGLAAPTSLGPLAAERWRELYRRSIRQPADRWMDSAEAWLEAGGPPVPSAWRDSWPHLIDSAEEADAFEEMDAEAEVSDPGYGEGALDLSRLARTLRDHRVLRDRFATRLQAEKLQSLRQLAYGLSHEINNPLANISTRAQQLADGEEDEQRRQRLARITESAMRAHEMIADLMYFARPPRPRRSGVDVAALAATVIEEVAARCEERKIAIQLRSLDRRSETGGNRANGKRAEQGSADSAAMIVDGDRDQLADALRAMVRNSIEAVGTSGAIDVRLSRRGARLRIDVTDSGPGLSDEARQHAFDPYYSGREAGRGLGLGLCRVYRVARAHGGGAAILSLAVGCRTRMWIAGS